jgi:DNA invertase Pin-like site-specific DNA recombinase
VSTEKQEKQGESLNTQTRQIIQYVDFLHGIIPDNCWKYKGQEHATPGQERSLLEQLLKDSDKGLFDAVIVNDPSRWSRDNQKNKEGLQILRNNGIRFFVGTVEYDLFNPTQMMFLGISTEMNEYTAKHQQLRSIESRIERAKKNMPSTGKIPYGRTYDKKTETWGIDTEKQKIIQQSADRYLSGEGLQDIARSFNMNAANLHKILTKRAGTQWLCSFVHPELNINEKVLVTIPSLLDDTTIKKIHDKSKANKTYSHGVILHNYLLSRMIFCSKCGYTNFGYTNRSGNRYYRHVRYRKINCTYHKYIPADEIENSVLIHLVNTLGDVERINNAIKNATPDISKVNGLTSEKEDLIVESKKINSQKEKVVEKVSKGILTDDEIQSQMTKLRDREVSISNRLQLIESELSNIPDKDKVKRLTALGMAVLADITKDPKSVFKKSYKWKRNLVEHAFSGTDAHGKRLGVYIEEDGEGWKFEIRGTLENTVLNLPLSDEYLVDTFKIDTEFHDVNEELDKIREDIKSKYALHLSVPCLL